MQNHILLERTSRITRILSAFGLDLRNSESRHHSAAASALSNAHFGRICERGEWVRSLARSGFTTDGRGRTNERVILGTLLAIRVKRGEGGRWRAGSRKWSKWRGQQNRTERRRRNSRVGVRSQDKGGRTTTKHHHHHPTPLEKRV